MWARRALPILTGVAILGGCVATPNPAVDRERPLTHETFAANVVDDIQAHDWQTLLAASDPNYYQRRVVAAGIPEVEYLAELLGLDSDANSITEDDELDWTDFDRIETASLVRVGDDGPPFHYSGQVTLTTGESLRLDVRIIRVQGRFVLTGLASQ